MSLVANYLCWPLELKDILVYNFFSKYSTTKGRKTTKKTMKFQEDHPSFKHLMLVERKTPVIPVIKYYDFPDIKLFGGTCIDDDDAMEMLNEINLALDHMERYSKVAVVQFCPFFTLEDIQGTNGKFLAYFCQCMSKGKLKEKHQTYLFNAQGAGIDLILCIQKFL